MTSGMLETVETTQTAEPGDHERLAHYVNKNDHMKATLNGVPIRAICGKIWVPNRDGTKFPVCPECKEIYEQMKDE